mmetsp:Transcript_7551/g.30603  ORF Transcript_7551/g.30603 Transcript_7551/m.30603 type:complete len:256 (+) Transcript_7551:300-1067(+)
MTFTTSRKSKHCKVLTTTRAQSRKEIKRVLGRRGDWCSSRSSRAEGFVDVALARGRCNLATRWRSNSSSSCTIPSIEIRNAETTLTPQPRNEDRQELERHADHLLQSPRAPSRWNLTHRASHPGHLQHHLVRLQEPRRPRGIVPGRHHLGALLRRHAVSLQRPSQPLASLGDCRLAQVPAERVHREGPRGDVLDGDVGVRGLGGVRRLREATGGHEEGHLVRRRLEGVLMRSLGRADGSIRAVAGPARHEHRRGH